MTTDGTLRRLDHLSFKGNLKHTRYGWLRLTPAYSTQLVSELLGPQREDNAIVLDPFCGTGTTALVCAERGIECDTTDINPFLLWLGQTKTRAYSLEEIENFKNQASLVRNTILTNTNTSVWVPPLHQIEKWWDTETLQALARAMHKIKEMPETVSDNVLDLLKISFCRTMIDLSNASFGHQSMSFKRGELLSLFPEISEEKTASKWDQSVALVADSACSPIIGKTRFLYGDARNLSNLLEDDYYSCVITSPPYPNRMSYIRELRPYMYWLGYLHTGKEAGELDWQAIGGTWGSATSNLNKWEPDPNVEIPFPDLNSILEKIGKNSPVLALYVQKYFHDMVLHCRELFQVVKRGGTITYIVGNSKFYDVLLPVDALFASIFEVVGFSHVSTRIIRKRSSKKELFEFAVSAKKI